MGDIIFQKATLADKEKVQNISIKTFSAAFGHQNTKEDMEQYLTSSFSDQQIEKELSDVYSEFYLVYVEDLLIGYLKINIEAAQSEPIDDGIEIERIYLLPNYQGKGVGQQMMDKVIDIAEKRKKKVLWLGVWDQNVDAIRFYERNGFKKFGKHSFLLGNDMQMDFLMQRILEYVQN